MGKGSLLTVLANSSLTPLSQKRGNIFFWMLAFMKKKGTFGIQILC